MAPKFIERIPVLRRFAPASPTVAVIRLEGVIAARGQRALSLRRYAGAIERAFKLRGLKAVALAINSPGGSPAQSALLYRRIRQLAAERAVPVIAFTEDVAASGGYWLALAADEIYAEDTSLVGVDRRHHRRLRLRPGDQQARHRAPPLHRRREQIADGPVPARARRRRGAAEDAAAGFARQLQGSGARAARRQAQGRRSACSSAARSLPAAAPSAWDSSTASAKCAACCAPCSAKISGCCRSSRSGGASRWRG